MFKIETIVVGAGVIGLSIARALGLRGREVLVLEQEAGIGQGTSSRNSEVIHAGLYYEPGSLKARLCVEGRRALYRYCADRGVAHRRCGKLVVATSSDEDGAVRALHQRALANGVEDLELIDAPRLKELEPHFHATSALLSNVTGIVDAHGLMLAYQGDAETNGVTVQLRTPVTGGTFGGSSVAVRTGGDDPAEIETGLLINAAGLGAWDVSKKLSGLDPKTIPPRHLGQGKLFRDQRPRALQPPDLPRAGRRRPRHPPHLRSWRAGQVRARRGVGRPYRLRRRPRPRARFLCRDPPLLARSPRWLFGSRLCGHQAPHERPRGAGRRLRHPGPR